MTHNASRRFSNFDLSRLLRPQLNDYVENFSKYMTVD